MRGKRQDFYSIIPEDMLCDAMDAPFTPFLHGYLAMFFHP